MSPFELITLDDALKDLNDIRYDEEPLETVFHDSMLREKLGQRGENRRGKGARVVGVIMIRSEYCTAAMSVIECFN